MSPKDLLGRFTVDDLPSSGKVVTVKAEDSFEAAFEQLISAKVLSAPVEGEGGKGYIGFLDLRDLVSVVLNAASDPNPLPKGASLSETLLHLKEYYKVTGGVTVSYMARRNPFVSLPQGAPLLDAAKALAASTSASRVHRLAIVDKEDPHKIVSIFSQSTLTAFLAKHLKEVEIASKTVKELGIGTFPALHVSEATPAVEVLRLLDSKQRSGVAITNANGVVIGNISGRDLKSFIAKPDMERLKLPIAGFLKEIREEQVDIRVPAITVDFNTTFGMVVEKLVATRVHRLYVTETNSSLKPLGVISLSDVVKQLMK
jgi:CBS domain-containing protein